MKKNRLIIVAAVLVMALILLALLTLDNDLWGKGQEDGPDKDAPDDLYSIGDLVYQFSESAAVVSGVSDNFSGNALAIPDSVEHMGIRYSVASIGEEAFSGCTSLASITIPDSVTSIGPGAFYGCRSLKSVEIPDSVISIGKSAFSGCTSLASISLPAELNYLGSFFLSDCPSLAEITFNNGTGNSKYAVYDSILYEISEDGLILLACPSLAEAVSINENTFQIGPFAFDACAAITSLTIPANVSAIDDCAFRGCTSLESIAIPGGVTSIGVGTFSGCTSLTSITIPDSVALIGQWAFRDCTSLTSITIPDSVASIGEWAFQGCTSLESITIPGGVTSIGQGTFIKCISLKSVELPDGLTSIGPGAFYDCISLESITIPDSVTSIEDSAFIGCSSLTSITIPDGVTSIIKNTFYDCTSLKSVELPDSIASIGEWAFVGCSSLTSITIPDKVASIGQGAFYKCTSLESIIIPSGVTSIGDVTFYGCISLTSVAIPDSVASIGEWAFYKCTSLESITIPDSVTSIGESAFRGCIIPASIVIPDSVTSIGESAFLGCTSLESIIIPSSVTSIGESVFVGCTSLESIFFETSADLLRDRSITDYDVDFLYYGGMNAKDLATWENMSSDYSRRVAEYWYVSFYDKDNNNALIDKLPFEAGQPVTIPDRDGYAPSGLFEDASSADVLDPYGYIMPNKDISLYVEWTDDYSIVTYVCEGSVTKTIDVKVANGGEHTILDGSQFSDVLGGYQELAGWSLRPGSEMMYKASEKISEWTYGNLSLYAVLKTKTPETYDVALTIPGIDSSLGLYLYSEISDVRIKLSLQGDNTYYAEDVPAGNYTLLIGDNGYYYFSDASSEFSMGGYISITGDRQIIFGDTCILHMHVSGDSDETEEMFLYLEKGKNNLTNTDLSEYEICWPAKRLNYSFDGWYEDAEKTVKYDSYEIITSDLELYGAIERLDSRICDVSVSVLNVSGNPVSGLDISLRTDEYVTGAQGYYKLTETSTKGTYSATVPSDLYWIHMGEGTLADDNSFLFITKDLKITLENVCLITISADDFTNGLYATAGKISIEDIYGHNYHNLYAYRGYYLEGFYTDESHTKVYDTTSLIDDDIVLYPKLEKYEYDVSLDLTYLGEKFTAQNVKAVNTLSGSSITLSEDLTGTYSAAVPAGDYQIYINDAPVFLSHGGFYITHDIDMSIELCKLTINDMSNTSQLKYDECYAASDYDPSHLYAVKMLLKDSSNYSMHIVNITQTASCTAADVIISEVTKEYPAEVTINNSNGSPLTGITLYASSSKDISYSSFSTVYRFAEWEPGLYRSVQNIPAGEYYLFDGERLISNSKIIVDGKPDTVISGL